MNFIRVRKALLFLASFALVSCSEQSPKQDDPKTLRINFFAEPPSLDPRRVTYSISSNILPMLYDGLMRFDPSGKLKPSVAKEVSVSEDGKTYIFKLRKTYWSNGKKVKAQDFEESWKWILNPENPAPMASHLYCIRGARSANEGKSSVDNIGVYAKDSETLIVHLEEPLPFFPELTSTCNYFPVKNQPLNEQPICNGPFKLKSWKLGLEIVLEKNERYWDEKAVHFENIYISFLQDMNTELELFERGELDWAGAPIALGLAPNALPKLRANNLLNSEKFLCTYFYSFNTEKKPFQSPKARHALSLAIPRAEICEHITQGSETPATGFVPPEISFVHTPQSEFTDKELIALFNEGLDEQGITIRSLRPITITYNTSDCHHAIAQTIQHRWKSLFGIDVRLRNRDWKAHLSEVSAGNFDVARLTWKGMTSDPLHFLNIFIDPKHPMQRTSWRSSIFSHELNLAEKSADLDERLFHLAEAERILERDMPIAPIYFGTISYVKNPKLKDYYITQLGYIDFKWAHK